MSRKFVDQLHDTLHRLPLMPAHGSRRAGSFSSRNPRLRGHHRQLAGSQGAPRVLVRWQEWIAHLFGQEIR